MRVWRKKGGGRLMCVSGSISVAGSERDGGLVRVCGRGSYAGECVAVDDYEEVCFFFFFSPSFSSTLLSYGVVGRGRKGDFW